MTVTPWSATWRQDVIDEFAGKQPIDGDLTALAALSGTGIPRRTGTDTWSLLPSEEGLWTPVLAGTTTAGVATYSLQAGSYIKWGKSVFYTFTAVTTAHTGTGNIAVNGLPFVSVNRASNFWIGTIAANTPATASVGQISANVSQILLVNAATRAGIAIQASMNILGSGWYEAAS